MATASFPLHVQKRTWATRAADNRGTVETIGPTIRRALAAGNQDVLLDPIATNDMHLDITL